MDGPQGFAEEPHLLNLKVMRLSAPSLARHQAPFFLDPAKDASTNDILNSFRTALARKESSNPASIDYLDVPGASHSTMRDLPLSPMLSLPASFGTISLGETFTATLSLSNDSPYPVASPRLLAEMQSNTQKVVVGERVARPRQVSMTGTAAQEGTESSSAGEHKGAKGILDPGRSLDLKVGYEMRELGMNVLVVSVTYDSSIGPRDFVKYYKFNVTAPLAIKTKVHLPTSPSALLDPDEREQVYLEVHVQNVSPGTLVFEKVELQTVPGLSWLRGAEEVKVAEVITDGSTERPKHRNDVTEPLAPGNSKQYLFCLAPTPRPAFPVSSLFPPSYNPGTVLPLGRLDLVWRSAYGERGHLLTAMLNRRAPPVGTFSGTIRVQGGRTPPSRALENGLNKSVPPGSPSPLSKAPPLPPKTGTTTTTAMDAAYELDLVVLECDRKSAVVFEGMKMKLRLAIGEVGPFRQPGEQVLHLAIRYLTERERAGEEEGLPNGVNIVGGPDASGTSTPLMINHRPSTLDLRAQAGPSRTGSPRPGTPAGYSLGIPSGSSANTPRSVSRALPPPPPPPPSIPQQDEYEVLEELFPPAPEPSFPSPFATSPHPTDHGALGQLGPSLITLRPVIIRPLTRPSSHRDESPRSSLDGERVPPPPALAADKRKEGSVEFEMELMPEREGLAYAGGLRVLMLNDQEDCSKGGRVLGEWPSLGEVLIAV